MPKSTAAEKLTSEKQLFARVLEIQDEAARKKAAVDAETEAELARLADQIHEGDESPLSELDGGVVKSLYGLMPQIQRRLQGESEGRPVLESVSTQYNNGRPLYSNGAFLDALLVAARANGTDIKGYDGPAKVVVTPDSTPAGLREELHQAWQAAPPTDPFC